MQLRGFNLVPFTFDKQVLLLETLLHLWTCASLSSPEALHNVLRNHTLMHLHQLRNSQHQR